MVEKISLALFGSGYWGSKLAGEYLQFQNDKKNKFNFFGIVDPDTSRLKDLQNKFNLDSSKLFDNVKECLHNPEINAIHVATPSESHFEIASEALDQKKHVLVEKPMAMTSRDAFKLARLAEKNGRILLVGHIFRFNSALEKAKEILEQGQFGNINYIQLSWRDYLSPLPDRDIVFDLLPHPIDIVNFLTGEWPSSIYAHSVSYTRSPGDKKNEDMAFIILKMPDESSVQITLSWIQPGIKERVVSVTSSQKTMMVDTISQKLILCDTKGKENVAVSKNNTINSMISHFMKCILGEENPNNSSLVGAMTVGILSSARRSLSEKREVRMLE
jgi:UDP-N-acetylglucosamine 3-dehydrogenase